MWELYINCEGSHYVNVTTVYLCIANYDNSLFMKCNSNDLYC